MILKIDHDVLDRDGFTLVDDVVSKADIDEFESSIAAFSADYLSRRGETSDADDPFVEILVRDQEWRETLFPLLKNLRVLQRISSDVAASLDTSDAFEVWGFRVPLAWPSFRADPPAEGKYLLPMHQDYGSTRCHRAFRMWIPLRDANEDNGTIDVVPGSHRLGPLEYDVSDPEFPHVPDADWEHLGTHRIVAPAGTGVLIDPLLVHRSVMARRPRMKYVLLMNLQDLTTIMDPSDESDELGRRFRELTAKRVAATEG
jgi:hypothetical protein